MLIRYVMLIGVHSRRYVLVTVRQSTFFVNFIVLKKSSYITLQQINIYVAT